MQLAVAVSHSIKSSIVRKSYFVAVVCAALFLCSCEKERLSDSALNSTTSESSSAEAKKRFPFIRGGEDNGEDGGSSVDITNYGAMICPPNEDNWLNFQLDVADKLGISCLRGSTLVPSTWSSTYLLNAGYDVVLNFNSVSTTKENDPAPFVTNINQYQQDLRDILNTFTIKPVMAVIENEESNRFFYSGSASEYINQLSAAINVMHSYGIKVANGGITNQGLNYLVYQDFIDQGKTDSAEMFKNLTHVAPTSSTTQERGEFVDKLLNAYRTMGLDYINFHWKGDSPNTDDLKQVIAYLKKRTGKPIISNELGQHDKDPNTLLAMMELCADQQLPYVLWYSPDEHDSKRATPLQHDDATLTSSGVAYQNYLVEKE